MKLYHGSTVVVKQPNIRIGRKNTDFGEGAESLVAYLAKRGYNVNQRKCKAFLSVCHTGSIKKGRKNNYGFSNNNRNV